MTKRTGATNLYASPKDAIISHANKFKAILASYSNGVNTQNFFEVIFYFYKKVRAKIITHYKSYNRRKYQVDLYFEEILNVNPTRIKYTMGKRLNKISDKNLITKMLNEQLDNLIKRVESNIEQAEKRLPIMKERLKYLKKVKK